MPTTLSTFETLVANRVRDAASRFTTAQTDDAITAAVKRYGQLRPLIAAQDYAGDGVTFDLALPTGFVDGKSTIQLIEYPAAMANVPTPSYITPKDWMFYRSPSAVKLRLLVVVPNAGETVRVTYTMPHTVNSGGSTIWADDEEAVADLAASIALRQLAAIYAGTVDPTITADSVDYKSKAFEYSKLANDLEKRWAQHMGLDQDSEIRAGSTMIDVSRPDSLGLDHLTHPSRYRDD